ncbi:MAG TPA: cytochrome c [Acidobacteriaceae bacterium]|nr:cytochrome c [Acidobacteriaceae bacterium]
MKKALYLAVIGSMAALMAATAASAQTGADVYKSRCQMCHGADGSGNTPAGKAMKAIPFKSPDLVKKTDAALIAATESGKGKMPAYKGKLSDAQIKDVIAYIRTLQKK